MPGPDQLDSRLRLTLKQGARRTATLRATRESTSSLDSQDEESIQDILDNLPGPPEGDPWVLNSVHSVPYIQRNSS